MAGPLDCDIPAKFADKIIDTLGRAGFTAAVEKTIDDFKWYAISSGAEQIGMGVLGEVRAPGMVSLMWSRGWRSSRLAGSFIRILVASGAAFPPQYGYSNQYYFQVCAGDEIRQWIEKIQKAGFRIEVWPALGGARSQYRDGAVGAWPMRFRIYTGPAVQPTSGAEAHYIAIEKKCWALRSLQSRVLKMTRGLHKGGKLDEF